MKYFYFCIALIFCSYPVFGQLVPDVSEVDVDVENMEEVRTYCQPGVRNKSRSKGLEIIYGNRGSGQLSDSNIETGELQNSYSRWDHLQVKLRAPVIIKDDFKLLVGYKYYQERFQFTEIGSTFPAVISNLNENNLKSSSFSILTNKSFNERSYGVLELRYMVSGNFSGLAKLGDRYATYRAFAMYAVKPSTDFEWGFALNVSKNFRRFNVIPFFILHKNFSEKWGLEALLPGYIFARCNLKPGNILLSGLEFGNKNFRLDIPQEMEGDLDYAYNQSHIKALVKYQRRVIPWIWVSVQVGYQYNLNTNFEGKNAESTSFQLRANNAPYFRVGVFLSPHSKEDRMIQSSL